MRLLKLSRDGVITTIVSCQYSSTSKIAVADWIRCRRKMAELSTGLADNINSFKLNSTEPIEATNYMLHI